MKGIVALDIGTTSLRSTLYDEGGRALPSDQRMNAPRYFPDGRVEQDASAWELLVPAVLKAAAARAAEGGIQVEGIAVTAQRSSVIAVDAEGHSLLPAIMWQDLRTADLAASLAASNEFVFSKTGLRISTVFSALKMLWIRRNEPGVFSRTHKLLGIQDFVLHILTGRFVTDHSLASRTNLFDLASLSWDPRLLELFEVEAHMLCEALPPGSIAGGLLPSIAREAGFREGLPVISAGGDQQCAALGLGLFSGERAITNTGTGSYLIGHSPLPLIDRRMRVSCNVSALPGAYILEAALPTSGSVYRWFAETFSRGDSGTGPSFDELNAEAEVSGPGAKGVLLLPHFNGSGSPDWNPEARGLFHNLSLATKRGDLARAILEGIAFELAGSLSLLEELCGPVEAVSVSGGLTRSALFNQIQADVFGKPTLRYRSGEATSLGAWMAGAVATGLASSYPAAFDRATEVGRAERFEPDARNHALYVRLRGRASALYGAISSPEIRRLFAEGM